MKKNLFPANGALRALLIALLTLSVFVVPVAGLAGGTAIDAAAAERIALADAGFTADAVALLKTEYDLEDGSAVFETEFTAAGAEYEYHILAADGSVLKKKTEWRLGTAPAFGTANLGREEAIALCLADAGLDPAVKDSAQCLADTEDGRAEYKISFTTAGWLYTYEIDVLTGALTEKSMEYTGEAAAAATGDIGIEKAKEIALAHANLSADAVTFKKAKQDTEDGRTVYEIEFLAGGFEYEYEIDARTGAVLDFEKDRD